jgi:ribosomal protein S12 methylthiotransferase accessory factor
MMEITLGEGLRVSAAFDGYSVETDQPAGAGGDASAPSPSHLFLASLATCAGFFALRFMRERGIDTAGAALTLTHETDAATGLASEVAIHLTLPPGFPDRYRRAIVLAMDQCKVKRQLEQPPRIAASAS